MLFFLCPLCAVFRQMKRQAAAAHNDPQALRLCIHYFRYKHLHLRRNPLPLFRHTIQKARRGPRWIIKIYNHNSVLISSYSIFQNRSFYTPRKIFYKTSKTGSQNLTHYPSGTPDSLKLYSLFCQNQFLGFNIAHYCHQVLLKSFGLYIYHIEFNFLSSFLNLLLHSNSKTDPLCPTLILIDDSCIAP